MIKRRRYNNEKRDEVIAVYLQGNSVQQTSLITGVPGTSVHRLIKDKMSARTLSHSLSVGHAYRDNLFKDLESEECQYWLGFITADGYLGKKNQLVINLSVKDEIHLDRFIAYTSCQKLLIPATKSVRAHFTNKAVSETLHSYGLTTNKSMTIDLTIPLTVPLVRGIFDGDGCVSDMKKSPKFEIATGSKALAEKLNLWFYEQLGYFLNFKQYKNLYFIGTGSIPKFKDVYELLYRGSTISLARKKIVFGSIIEKSLMQNSANSGKAEPLIPSQQ